MAPTPITVLERVQPASRDRRPTVRRPGQRTGHGADGVGVTLRLYNPGPSALTLDWVPPAVERIE